MYTNYLFRTCYLFHKLNLPLWDCGQQVEKPGLQGSTATNLINLPCEIESYNIRSTA